MAHRMGRARAAIYTSRIATTLALTLAPLALLTEATTASAQDDTTAAPPKKPKKKKPKADAPAPEPVSDPTPPAAAPEPAPAPAPQPAPAAAPAPAAPADPDADLPPITDTFEKPAQTYYFLGIRYQLNIIPQFMVNLFVNDGATFISHTVGAELDIRRDNFSIIPSITYSSYNFGDTLFFEKNVSDTANNYSDVSSTLGAIYVGADLLWSKEISNHVSFEYGAGLGIGVLFGSLTNDWVYQNNNGPLVGTNGTHYSPCVTQGDGYGCSYADHTNADPNHPKVNGYHEPNWFSGGSVPVLFPRISLPELGIRYKPIKELESRFLVGFSLTGFFFGLSVDYGFEKREHQGPGTKPEESPASASH